MAPENKAIAPTGVKFQGCGARRRAAAKSAGGYDRVFNLGDIVGYGANPNEVVARIALSAAPGQPGPDLTGIAVDWVTHRVYVADATRSVVAIIDGSINAVNAEVEVNPANESWSDLDNWYFRTAIGAGGISAAASRSCRDFGRGVS